MVKPEPVDFMVDTVDILEHLGMVQNGIQVLDVGCGPADWGRTLLAKGYKLKYLGLDCQLRAAMKRIPGLTLRHLDVYNGHYNPNGRLLPSEVVFPVNEASMDLVIAHSLFTHLGNYSNAESYMAQVERALKLGGYLWITFFQSPPNKMSTGFARSVYTQDQISWLLQRFTYIKSIGGFTDGYNDQLMVAARYDGQA